VIDTEERETVHSKEMLPAIKQFLVEIAEEILSQNELEHLYPLELLKAADERGTYPKNELIRNISELYEDKWIIPDEKLTKNLVLSVLDHKRVYNFIIENPGCDTLDIMKALDISFRYALKNLEILFKFRFIRARKYSQFFLYFPFEMNEEEDIVYCLGRNLTTRQIMRYLYKHQRAATTSEIAKALNKREITVQRKLTRLAQAQIVSIIQKGLLVKYKYNKDKIANLKVLLKKYKKN